MSIVEIRRVHRARPFRPFWICLADGREIRVAHPEFLMVVPDMRTLVVGVPRVGLEIIDAPLVTGISYRRQKRA